MKLSFKRNKFWFCFFFIKVFYMIFGHIIFTRISSLGDTARYLNASVKFSQNIFLNSTSMMEYFGGIAGNLFGPVFGSLPFCILVFHSTFNCISNLKLKNFYFIFILILLSMPTYGLWTSVASKESVVASFMLILMNQFINIINRKKVHLLAVFLSYYIIFIFKIQFFPFIFTFHLFLFLYHKLNYKFFCYFIFIPSVFILFTSLVYIYMDVIDDMAFHVSTHFDPYSNSTRSNFLLIEKYDFFKTLV